MYSKAKALIGIVLVAVMASASMAAVSAMGSEAPNKMKATAKNASGGGGGFLPEVGVAGDMYLGSGISKLSITVSVDKAAAKLLDARVFVFVECLDNVGAFHFADGEFNKKGKFSAKSNLVLADYSTFDDDFNEIPAVSAEGCTATIEGRASLPMDGSSTTDFVTAKKISVSAKVK